MVERWVLLRGQTRLGVLRVVDVDQPWFACTFEPTAAFEQVQELFDEERRFVGGWRPGCLVERLGTDRGATAGP
jgi:hypothetical protein